MNRRGRVLVVRLSSIGDVLLTTPVVRALHRAGWEVHYLTQEAYGPLLRHNPYIHTLHRVKHRRAVGPAAVHLRAYRFDWVVDLHKNWASYRLRMRLRRPTVGYDKAEFRRWWITQVNRRLRVPHVVHRYMAAVQPLGAEWDGEGLDFFFPPKYQLPENLLPPEWRGRPFGVVVMGAAHATKRIPPAKVLEFLRAAQWPVVLLGGTDVAREASQVAEAYPSALNLGGRTDLYASADIIRRSRWVLTPDTGMMHLAAALRRPIISVWGSTSPRLGMAPFLDDPAPRIVEHPTLACRPCHRLGRRKCPKGHFRCMLELDLGAEGRRIRALSME